MVEVIHHPEDAAQAQRLQRQLPQTELPVTLVWLSAAAAEDAGVLAELERALDAGRRILPLLPEGGRLPALIEHLEPLAPDDSEGLAQRLAADEGALPLRVHTPALRSANRRAALVVLVFVVLMFLAALYGVGVMGLQAPREEYDAVETQVVATRNAFIEEALPRSTADAADFAVTAEVAATALRPLLVATATARAGEAGA